MRVDAKKLRSHFAVRKNPGRNAGIPPSIRQENLYRLDILKTVYRQLVNKILEAFRAQIKRDLRSNELVNSTTDVNEIARQMMQEHNPFINWAKERESAAATAQRNFERVDESNRKQFNQSINQAIGVDLKTIVKNDAISREILERSISNAKLIVTVPREKIGAIADIVNQGLDRGDDFFNINKQVNSVFEQEQWKITRIARDQVSKFNASLNEIRQTQYGVTHYFWRTAGDERVRDSHASKEGERFAWDSPPSDTGHPGEDINCRCYADPDLTSMTI